MLLYHGTRYLKAIIKKGVILRPKVGCRHVSLTTRKYIAEYWAAVDRDNDEGLGYVLGFRKADLLIAEYRLESFADSWAEMNEYEVACHADVDFRLCYSIQRVIKPVEPSRHFQMSRLG